MKDLVRCHLPPRFKPAVGYLYYMVMDIFDLLRGKRDPLIPPKRMMFIGSGDYKIIGNEFFRYFLELGQLKPQDCVLDVGCGIGRMAVPLTGYLASEATYHGFDIVKQGIHWCTENISTEFPNFHFELANVYNKLYNPKGECPSSAYKFHHEKDTFDFAFATSVFTHMLPADLENYLAEIARVLKPGGRCLVTLFLLNSESLNLIRVGKSSIGATYEVQKGCMTVNPNAPEEAVAYDETLIRGFCEKFGLRIVEPIHYGSWCGRQDYLSYQDILIALK